MLTQKEEFKLKKYCEKDESLSILIQHLEDAHRMELSRISHEIRNPVTLINSFLQLTESHHPEVTSFDTWNPVIENMAYLKQLLVELSDYNNSKVLHKEQFSLSAFLHALVHDCQASMAPVSLIFSKDSAIPPAYFDRTKLRAAVLNLLRNAAEALSEAKKEAPAYASSPKGRLLIRVSVSFDGEYFHISVANNGPMIAAEDIPELFTPFVTHKKEGTGLGLAIVKNVALAHGGSVSVSSTSKETCFTLNLPLSYES